MGDHSIFGEAGEMGGRDRPPRDTGTKRPNLVRSLFGTRRLVEGYKASAQGGND